MNKLNRTKDSGRNLIFGIINNVLKMIMAFFIRTIIIYKLGIEYQGLNGLFTSILSILSVAELGFDTATVTVMYTNIAKEDTDELCALLKFIKNVYLLVGTLILVMGLACIPFLHLIIKDYDVIPPDVNIYVIYIVFLLNSVVSYYFGGYRSSIFSAFGRQDILSKLNSLVTFVFYGIEAVFLLLTRNYLFYITLILIGSIVYNLLMCWLSKKKYPQLIARGEVSQESRRRLKKTVLGLVFGKIGGTLSTSFDNLVISAFLGISIVGFYSNYHYIEATIESFMMLIYTSIQAGLGNSLVTETIEKNYEDMLCLTFIYDWIVGWCSIALIYLFQPFINIWIGREGVLPNFVLVLIVMNFYVSKCSGIFGTYKNALGIWWEDRYRGIVTGIVNLCINLLMAISLKKYGNSAILSGIVLSTLISNVFISIPWAIKITFKVYFKSGLKRFIMDMFLDYGGTILVMLCCYPIMQYISRIYERNNLRCLLFRLLVCISLPNLIYFFIYRKRKIYSKAKVFLFTHLRILKLQ